MNSLADQLPDEQRVFLELVADILDAIPGLTYDVLLDPERIGSIDRSIYAVLPIETNPIYDLSVSLELAETAFHIRVNGMAFSQQLSSPSRLERWIQRRCRDVELLTGGDLKLKHQMFMGLPASTTLSARHDGKWREIGKRESGWIGAMSFFAPWGLFITHGDERIYRDWYLPDPSDADEAAAGEPSKDGPSAQ
jgi:hypothetical protein